jgi:hypothetical protein
LEVLPAFTNCFLFETPLSPLSLRFRYGFGATLVICLPGDRLFSRSLLPVISLFRATSPLLFPFVFATANGLEGRLFLMFPEIDLTGPCFLEKDFARSSGCVREVLTVVEGLLDRIVPPVLFGGFTPPAEVEFRERASCAVLDRMDGEAYLVLPSLDFLLLAT